MRSGRRARSPRRASARVLGLLDHLRIADRLPAVDRREPGAGPALDVLLLIRARSKDREPVGTPRRRGGARRERALMVLPSVDGGLPHRAVPGLVIIVPVC